MPFGFDAGTVPNRLDRIVVTGGALNAANFPGLTGVGARPCGHIGRGSCARPASDKSIIRTMAPWVDGHTAERLTWSALPTDDVVTTTGAAKRWWWWWWTAAAGNGMGASGRD